MRRSRVPASREPHGRPQRAARGRPADPQAACGHARYTKGCDLCALAGIYQDHLSRPGLTPAERSQVSRLYLAGDKAALFKLWQARPDDDDT
jgi:hypothetical protein